MVPSPFHKMNTSSPPSQIRFGSFRLDLSEGSLWKDRARKKLAPKALATLTYLLEHSPNLVTTDELFAKVWQGTSVGSAALTFTIGELRRALGDSAKAPLFIETVHRRGYRFIAPVSREQGPSREAVEGPSPTAQNTMVGREKELQRVHTALQELRAGQGQFLFISGEAGIGKTTLLDAALRSQAQHSGELFIARGQCVEQYGAGEAFLPVLDALTRMIQREDLSSALPALFAKHAPHWLLNMPAVATTEELEQARQRASGTATASMLREFTNLMLAVCQDRPLVMALEDLHWSDRSTIELLGALARSPERLRLLVIATYRPSDSQAAKHPLTLLQGELLGRNLAQEIPLGLLTRRNVGAFVDSYAKVPQSLPAEKFANTIYEHTEGNPLFMVAAVQHFCERYEEAKGSLHPTSSATVPDTLEIPSTLKAMLGGRIDRLSEEEQTTLEAASTVGRRFSATELAAATAGDRDQLETICERLARREGVIETVHDAERSDGVQAFGFRHMLYQRVLHDRIGHRRRSSYHRRLAERLFRQPATPTTASRAAHHFEQAGDPTSAYPQHCLAADQAEAHNAPWEAASHLRRALESLSFAVTAASQTAEELRLRFRLAVCLMATHGYANNDCLEALLRIDSLIEHLKPADQPPHLQYLLPVIWTVQLNRGNLAAADEASRRHRMLASDLGTPEVLGWASMGRGNTCLYAGHFDEAATHYERALECTPAMRTPEGSVFGENPLDPETGILADLALLDWYRGRLPQSQQRREQCERRAGDESSLLTQGYLLSSLGFLARLSGEPSQVLHYAEELLARATDFRMAHYRVTASALRGWAKSKLGEAEAGANEVSLALSAHQQAGAGLFVTVFSAMLADCQLAANQAPAAIATVDRGLEFAKMQGLHYQDAELYELKGRALLLGTPNDAKRAKAAAHLEQAILVAQEQNGRSLELSALRELSLLRHEQGRAAQALKSLKELRKGFPENLRDRNLERTDRALARIGDPN